VNGDLDPSQIVVLKVPYNSPSYYDAINALDIDPPRHSVPAVAVFCEVVSVNGDLDPSQIVVLKVPYNSPSYYDAINALDIDPPRHLRNSAPLILKYIRTWPQYTDGVEILTDGSWPAEVARAIRGGAVALMPDSMMEAFWALICSMSCPQPEGDDEVEPQEVWEDEEAVLPQICMNDLVLNQLVDEAISALRRTNHPPRLFVRSGQIVRIDRDERGRPVIKSLNRAAVRGEIDRAARWYVVKSTKEGVPVEIDKTPPLYIAEDLLERPPEEWTLPPLVGLVQSPPIRPDGEIVTEPGYDPVTRTLYAPEDGFSLGPVPEEPTDEDIRSAVETILEMFCDFPFVQDEHDANRANAIAALITAVVRPIIDGPVPLYIVTKPVMGSGASLLQKVIAAAATGVEPVVVPTPATREEWEKRIFSLLLQGRPAVILDNVEGTLSSEALAVVLTTQQFTGRVLGQSRVIELPARTFWMANGNNVQLGGDMARRVWVTRIDPHMAMPWLRTEFRHPDLIGWVMENRGAIVAAVLTLVRAWIRAGRPAPRQVPPVGGYESWRDVVGGIMECTGLDGFLGNANEIWLEADTGLREWETFLGAIHDIWGSSPWQVRDLEDRLRSEIEGGGLTDQVWLIDSLPGHLEEALRDERRSFSRVCGRALARQVDRRFPSGLCLKKGEKVKRAQQWVVVLKDAEIISDSQDGGPDGRSPPPVQDDEAEGVTDLRDGGTAETVWVEIVDPIRNEFTGADGVTYGPFKITGVRVKLPRPNAEHFQKTGHVKIL